MYTSITNILYVTVIIKYDVKNCNYKYRCINWNFIRRLYTAITNILDVTAIINYNVNCNEKYRCKLQLQTGVKLQIHIFEAILKV